MIDCQMSYSEYNKHRYERGYHDSGFSKLYLEKRTNLYESVVRIINKLNCRTVLEIGCSFGLLVDRCNSEGIDAYGVDFDIDSLKEYHRTLGCKDKFFYGSIDDNEVVQNLCFQDWDIVICLDTLRFLTTIDSFHALNPNYLYLKESCNNRRVIESRKNQKDFRLWSPLEIVNEFTDYFAYRVYLPRHLLSFRHPAPWLLKTINAVSPTYHLIMKR